MNQPEGYKLLDQINGEQLGSVVFVQDYFQLVFDGPTISIYSNRTTVYSKNTQSKSWDDQFRNMLCGQIAKIVKRISIDLEKELSIEFRDKSRIVVSLHPDDQTRPEAIYCHGFSDGEWTVA